MDQELSFSVIYKNSFRCCNPLLDCFLCDFRSLLLAVPCLFWPYTGPWPPPVARHPSQPVATLQHQSLFFRSSGTFSQLRNIALQHAPSNILSWHYCTVLNAFALAKLPKFVRKVPLAMHIDELPPILFLR